MVNQPAEDHSPATEGNAESTPPGENKESLPWEDPALTDEERKAAWDRLTPEERDALYLNAKGPDYAARWKALNSQSLDLESLSPDQRDRFFGTVATASTRPPSLLNGDIDRDPQNQRMRALGLLYDILDTLNKARQPLSDREEVLFSLLRGLLRTGDAQIASYRQAYVQNPNIPEAEKEGAGRRFDQVVRLIQSGTIEEINRMIAILKSRLPQR